MRWLVDVDVTFSSLADSLFPVVVLHRHRKNARLTCEIVNTVVVWFAMRNVSSLFFSSDCCVVLLLVD